MLREQRQEIATLRRQWMIVVACYGAALIAGFNLLRQGANLQQSLQWLLLSSMAMAIQLGILWWALPYNRRQGRSLAEDESPLLVPALGYANAITLLRGLFTCMLAGFLFAPQLGGPLAWVPAVLYTLERLVDFADGYVARVTRSETKLGEILDIEFDGLGFLTAILLGVQYGKLPPWYLLLGLGRQLFVLGIWLRRRAGRPVCDLPPSKHRRMIAGFETGFITVALWPLWPPDVTLPAAYVMAIPLIFSFGRDWLVVSGVVDASSQGYRRAREWGKVVVEGWLPLAARLGAALLGLTTLWQTAPPFAPWQRGVAGLGVEGATLVFGGLILLGLLAVAAVAIGAAGRVGALVLAGIAALDIATGDGQGGGSILLLVCSLIIIHLGSGRWAIWRPEESLLRAKAGAPRA